jgi:hypothetical protein
MLLSGKIFPVENFSADQAQLGKSILNTCSLYNWAGEKEEKMKPNINDDISLVFFLIFISCSPLLSSPACIYFHLIDF